MRDICFSCKLTLTTSHLKNLLSGTFNPTQEFVNLGLSSYMLPLVTPPASSVFLFYCFVCFLFTIVSLTFRLVPNSRHFDYSYPTQGTFFIELRNFLFTTSGNMRKALVKELSILLFNPFVLAFFLSTQEHLKMISPSLMELLQKHFQTILNTRNSVKTHNQLRDLFFFVSQIFLMNVALSYKPFFFQSTQAEAEMCFHILSRQKVFHVYYLKRHPP